MKHQCIEHGNVGFCDGCLVDSLHYEIAQLKSKLNQKKSECAGLQGCRVRLIRHWLLVMNLEC